MQIANGHAASIVFGAILTLGGALNSWMFVRNGYVSYRLGGISRDGRPLLFWMFVSINVLLALVGLYLLTANSLHLS